jgi:hypothetical protein
VAPVDRRPQRVADRPQDQKTQTPHQGDPWPSTQRPSLCRSKNHSSSRPDDRTEQTEAGWREPFSFPLHARAARAAARGRPGGYWYTSDDRLADASQGVRSSRRPPVRSVPQSRCVAAAPGQFRVKPNGAAGARGHRKPGQAGAVSPIREPDRLAAAPSRFGDRPAALRGSRSWVLDGSGRGQALFGTPVGQAAGVPAAIRVRAVCRTT